MDSVSQIALGAAMGELVLGRKLGNKAMLWGAIGGTIPDLDIITSPFMSEIDSLIFHRGISHSISFAILAGLGFGWLIHRLHDSKYYRNFLWAVLSLVICCIPISIFFFLFGQDIHKYYYSAGAIVAAIGLYVIFYYRYGSEPIKQAVNPDLRQWQWMFFWAFITHALLDCFTMYGTQLFLPFSDYRVAFSSISVADPIGYTIPFLILLGITMRYRKESVTRKKWAWAAVGLSSLYLLFTVWHKQHVYQEFDRQLTEQGISYNRHSLGPFIFSNLLWSITVENEDRFYNGTYSIFDTSPIVFLPIEKNNELIADGKDDKTIQTLQWFTKGFYNIMERPDGLLQFNDLRYGTFRQEGHIKDFIFRFHIAREAPGKYDMKLTLGGPEEDSDANMFGELYERIAGR